MRNGDPINRFLLILDLFRVTFAAFYFPFIIMCCIYIGLGGDIKHVNVGIVSDELGSVGECLNKSLITKFSHDFTCDLHKVSCDFINLVGSDDFFYKVDY